MRIFAIAAVAVLAITPVIVGCVAHPTPEQLAVADYGAYPENYQAIVKAWFSGRLKDPYSAVYEFGTPVKGYSTKAPIAGGGLDQYGYWVTVQVNAKNSFGGYTGNKTYRFLIRNAAIVADIDPPRER